MTRTDTQKNRPATPPARELLRRKGTPYDELGLDDPKFTDRREERERNGSAAAPVEMIDEAGGASTASPTVVLTPERD